MLTSSTAGVIRTKRPLRRTGKRTVSATAIRVLSKVGVCLDNIARSCPYCGGDASRLDNYLTRLFRSNLKCPYCGMSLSYSLEELCLSTFDGLHLGSQIKAVILGILSKIGSTLRRIYRELPEHLKSAVRDELAFSNFERVAFLIQKACASGIIKECSGVMEDINGIYELYSELEELLEWHYHESSSIPNMQQLTGPRGSNVRMLAFNIVIEWLSRLSTKERDIYRHIVSDSKDPETSNEYKQFKITMVEAVSTVLESFLPSNIPVDKRRSAIDEFVNRFNKVSKELGLEVSEREKLLRALIVTVHDSIEDYLNTVDLYKYWLPDERRRALDRVYIAFAKIGLRVDPAECPNPSSLIQALRARLDKSVGLSRKYGDASFDEKLYVPFMDESMIIRALEQDVFIVTIVGPVGSGKTTLAIRIARQLLYGEDPTPVYFLPIKYYFSVDEVMKEIEYVASVALKHFSRLIVVIDGLDEARESIRRALIGRLEKKYRAGGRVKFLITVWLKPWLRELSLELDRYAFVRQFVLKGIPDHRFTVFLEKYGIRDVVEGNRELSYIIKKHPFVANIVKRVAEQFGHDHVDCSPEVYEAPLIRVLESKGVSPSEFFSEDRFRDFIWYLKGLTEGVGASSIKCSAFSEKSLKGMAIYRTYLYDSGLVECRGDTAIFPFYVLVSLINGWILSDIYSRSLRAIREGSIETLEEFDITKRAEEELPWVKRLLFHERESKEHIAYLEHIFIDILKNASLSNLARDTMAYIEEYRERFQNLKNATVLARLIANKAITSGAVWIAKEEINGIIRQIGSAHLGNLIGSDNMEPVGDLENELLRKVMTFDRLRPLAAFYEGIKLRAAKDVNRRLENSLYVDLSELSSASLSPSDIEPYLRPNTIIIDDVVYFLEGILKKIDGEVHGRRVFDIFYSQQDRMLNKRDLIEKVLEEYNIGNLKLLLIGILMKDKDMIVSAIRQGVKPPDWVISHEALGKALDHIASVYKEEILGKKHAERTLEGLCKDIFELNKALEDWRVSNRGIISLVQQCQKFSVSKKVYELEDLLDNLRKMQKLELLSICTEKFERIIVSVRAADLKYKSEYIEIIQPEEILIHIKTSGRTHVLSIVSNERLQAYIKFPQISAKRIKIRYKGEVIFVEVRESKETCLENKGRYILVADRL